MQPISILSNERVFITGKTGSGKTFLARHLTRRVSRLVVMDSKGTLGGDDWNLIPWSGESVGKLREGEPVRIRVVPPISGELEDFWNGVFETCLKIGNHVIYIDEMYAIVPPGRQPSAPIFGVYTRGREFGLGVWASTQRPVWIPLVALSEAEHFFVFRLQLNEDKQRLAAFLGSEVMREVRDLHGFYYAKATDENVSYFRQLKPSLVIEKEIKPVEMPEMGNGRSRKIFDFFGGR